MDTDTLAAALLHDVVEDTDHRLEHIQKQFGEDVALMVDGVTKLGQDAFLPGGAAGGKCPQNAAGHGAGYPGHHHQAGDRLHNMRTMESMPPQKQRDKSLETMEIYAPLAHRWVSAPSRRSWRISPCATWTRLPIRRSKS
ncbi:MAG: HD domain-containing protein [Acutalibacteraceae bacterium]